MATDRPRPSRQSPDPMDRFIARQMTRPRIYGVHVAMLPTYPGESTPGWYVRNRGNLETAKRIHREELECLRILRGRIEARWKEQAA